jgi:Predicted amidohydrolase
MNKGIALYVPKDEHVISNPEKDDTDYAQALIDLNDVLEKCEHAENVALFLSTCRNAFLTLNALFAELSLVLASNEGLSHPLKAADYLTKNKIGFAQNELDNALRIIAQFDKKKIIWNDRDKCWADFQKACTSLNRLAQDRIHRLITKNKTRNNRNGYSWSEKLYEIDRADKPILAGKFNDIEQIASMLKMVLGAGKRFCLFVSYDDSPQQLSFLGSQVRQEQIAWAKVSNAIFEAAQSTNFHVSTNDGNIIVRKDDVTDPVLSFSSTHNPDASQLPEISKGISKIITVAAYKAYNDLCVSFKPNIAQTPMPQPFLIDLTSYDRDENNRKSTLSMNIIKNGIPKDPPKIVTIAVADFPIPKDSYTGQFHFNPECLVGLDGIAEELIKLAASKKADAIVFPEYAIPRRALNQVKIVARDNNIILIAGLEADWIQNKLVNEVAIIFPNTDEIYYQRKQKPSVYEDDEFFSDGKILLFKNTSIGDFGITICSDFLENAVQSVFTDPVNHPDFLFIPAYNPHPMLFKHIAIADSVRLYTNVIIANTECANGTCNNNGTCAIAPMREPEISGEYHQLNTGRKKFGITLFKMSIDALACRHRPKPETGYISPPASTKP